MLIDTEQDIALARRGLLSIVNDLCGSAASAPDQLMSLRTVISYNVPALRHVAVILDDPSNAQLKLLALDEKPLERRQVYQPFPKKRHRQGRYILYMSVASASRSGPSAAWITQYYHGVQYIHGLSKQDNANKVLWVDLAGCFGFRELAEQRLRIESQPEEIQRFFHSVEILDLSSSVDSYLFEGKPVGSITYALSQQVNSKKPQIVIVDGWQLIEDSAPPRLRAALVELERELIGEVGSLDCTIVWFGRPIVDECTSTKYQRRSVLPFESWSPHKSHVTDLVWNLPVRPSGEGRTAPMLDDLRVVIEHNAAHVNTPLFEVPLLRNWSARFWSKRLARRTTSEVTRRRQPLIAHEVVDSTAMASLRRELIYDSLESCLGYEIYGLTSSESKRRRSWSIPFP